jgi:hypothetical protein
MEFLLSPHSAILKLLHGFSMGNALVQVLEESKDDTMGTRSIFARQVESFHKGNRDHQEK